MDKTQRQIMLFLPLVFVFIIISFPAGLIVYWITTNVWTIVQQYIVKKRIGPVVPATATAAGSRGGEAGGGGGGGGPGPEPAPNGSGAGGGLGALLRGRLKPSEEPAAVGASTRPRRSGPPPPPPRKKKKRSGRRR
jgi:YidC/Oxa1 family membrane protein insertase